MHSGLCDPTFLQSVQSGAWGGALAAAPAAGEHEGQADEEEGSWRLAAWLGHATSAAVVVWRLGVRHFRVDYRRVTDRGVDGRRRVDGCRVGLSVIS